MSSETSKPNVVEQRSAGSALAPLWALIAVTSVLMVFLGGDQALYRHILQTATPVESSQRKPICCGSFCSSLRSYLRLHQPIYDWIDAVSPAMIVWTAVSSSVTVYRFYRRWRLGVSKLKDSVLFTEGAGLLLTLAQIVSFVWGVLVLDILSVALFLWWGPLFWATVYFYVKAANEKRLIDWNQSALGPAASMCPFSSLRTIPLKLPISWACKLTYVLYMVLFGCLGLRWQLFAFSAWIVNDQISKLFLELDADRLRRTFHDKWFVRIAYPVGLLYPFLLSPDEAESAGFLLFCRGMGVALLLFWIAGVILVSSKGELFNLPADAQLLRNIMYFKPNSQPRS